MITVQQKKVFPENLGEGIGKKSASKHFSKSKIQHACINHFHILSNFIDRYRSSKLKIQKPSYQMLLVLYDRWTNEPYKVFIGELRQNMK